MSIHASTTEINSTQKFKQNADGQTAFQLYTVDIQTLTNSSFEVMSVNVRRYTNTLTNSSFEVMSVNVRIFKRCRLTHLSRSHKKPDQSLLLNTSMDNDIKFIGRASFNAHTYTHMYVAIHTHTHIYVYVYTHNTYTYVRIYIYVCITKYL